MAKQPAHSLYSIFGFVIWGDLGPITIYRNHKGKIVWFAKTWPHKPPSPKQTIQRQKMSAAAAAWQLLAPVARRQWEKASSRASLCLTGYNLFCHWTLTNDNAAIATLEHQTGTTLLP